MLAFVYTIKIQNQGNLIIEKMNLPGVLTGLKWFALVLYEVLLLYVILLSSIFRPFFNNK